MTPPDPTADRDGAGGAARIDIDRGADPVIVVRMVGSPTAEQFHAHLRDMDGLLARQRPTAMVYDAREVGFPSAEARAAQLDWLRRHQDDIARYTVGIAFVSSSAGFRFMLSGILVVYRLPCEHRVCATVEEAVAWARGRLLTSQPGG